MIDALPLLLGPEGYQISRSVRLRSSASAYFSRTQATPTNNKIWTWSGWVKKGLLTSDIYLFAANNSTAPEFIKLSNSSSDAFEFAYWNGSAWAYQLRSTMVFRDPSAWYHIVVSVDTTQATASNRVRLYVNGVEVTSFSISSYPSQNTNTKINSAVAARLGSGFSSAYFDGYLTEINFIDGQALTPSSFGETDAVTGVWQPKKYTGTYGTNGFYLNFSDNSAATAAAIGKDYSGNGNNWTPNNISVTAGTTYDSMLDVPTPWADGGNGRGNYATLNPLSMYGTNAVISNASLTSTATGSANDRGWPSTIAAPGTGKWYAEFTFSTTDAGNNGGCGIMLENGTGAPGESATTVSWRDAGTLRQNASGTSYGSALSANDVVMLAYDAADGKVWFGKNGTWFASGDPATAANPSATGITTTGRFATYHYGVAATIHANFGQRPFAYTPPSGFKALNTQNLPTPTILKGNQYFDVNLWTGNGSSQSIVNSGSMQPDLVWGKKRNSAAANALVDSVRGVNKTLFSNLTDVEDTGLLSVTAFNSNGFSIGTAGNFNANGDTYVGWQWKEGATQGFDIVTYTGTGVARTVAHSLGVAPAMIIVKPRSAATGWVVGHSSLNGGTNPWQWYLSLESTVAQGTTNLTWNNTAPTSSVFSLGSGSGTNANAATYVAYLFSEVSQFSKAFSFTGNGSTDGVFVFTGFLPRLILLKRTDTTGNWYLWDTARNTYNALGEELYPNLSNAAASATDLDVLSNGFKMRNSTAGFNASGGTYIGFAWASNPFKYSLGF